MKAACAKQERAGGSFEDIERCRIRAATDFYRAKGAAADQRAAAAREQAAAAREEAAAARERGAAAVIRSGCYKFLTAGVKDGSIDKAEAFKRGGGTVTDANVCDVARSFGLGRKADAGAPVLQR